MTETAEAIKIQRGLKGVYFDRSPCTFIDGKAGELRYRGYSIHDLAEHSSFEETAFLLLNVELPSKRQHASCRLPFSTLYALSSLRIRWTCCARRFRHWRHSIRRRRTIRAKRPCAKPCG